MMKERFTTSKYRYLEMTIENVFRCNFNDTYYHETVYIELHELDKDKPVWVDPYNGRSRIGDTKIALTSCSDEEFTILEKKGDDIRESKWPTSSYYICSEDFDESLLLASNVVLRSKR